MKKLQTVLLSLLVLAAITGRAFADAIVPPQSEVSILMSSVFREPLVIVIIAAVVIIAALIVVGSIRTARKQNPKKRNPRD